MNKVIKKIKDGKIGIIPTDTIYGLVGSARIEETVERLYHVRMRNPRKPFIVLISSVDELQNFDIVLNNKTRNFLNNVWPGKVSVILPCPDDKFEYLHRGTQKLAFRVPSHRTMGRASPGNGPGKKDLRELLYETGPIVAPSANPEGKSPAKTIEEARDYFGDDVDFYVDGGKLVVEPSTVVRIENGNIVIIRKGAARVSDVFGKNF